MILGAGNVAFHISRHLHLAGHEISCVWSRNRKRAVRVVAASGGMATDNADEVPGDADFYLLTLSDSAIAEVATQFSGRSGIWMHTAGAVAMDVLASKFKEYGVLYPLQTLSAKRKVSLVDTPILVEGSSEVVTERITSLASSITGRVVEMESADRLKVHLAAVFANNFSNHMVTIATRILDEYGGDFSLLEPILRETFLNMAEAGPAGSQSGPAVRGDEKTMKKHLELLKGHPEWEKLYTFVSRDIERSRKSTIDPDKR